MCKNIRWNNIQEYNMLRLASVLLSFLLLVSATSLRAQGGKAGYFIQAEKLFSEKKYYEAIQHYEKYLSTENSISARSTPFAVRKKTAGKSNLSMHNEAVYNLAESYRHMNDFAKAEKWYKEATGFSPKAYPASQYWYGVSLRANNKPEEALEAFTIFQENYHTMDELLVGADKELANLQFLQEEKTKLKDGFFVTKQQGAANTSTYAANIGGDSVYFTSIYKDDTAEKQGKDYFVARLYKSAGYDDNITANPEKVNIPGEEGSHIGLATFAPKGKKMFFTRWAVENGASVSAIFSSEKTDTGWSKPVKLGEPINMPGSNSTQPFVTTDGNFLLFSSDRTGGVGKYDLWYATLDSNANALLVTNMGNIINTAGDEFSPSYHTLYRHLFYSSNGRVGMGGFDIYYAKGDFQLSNWEKVLNAGSPINSSKDDLYYVPTDPDNVWNTGLLSSDRDTDCCLDIFAVRQDNAQYVSGTIIDCKSRQPLQGVSLSIKDSKKGKTILSQQTDAAGKYSFQLKNTSRFDIVANKEGYEEATGNYVVTMVTGRDTIQNEALCLSFIVVNPSDPELDDALEALNESSTLAKFSYNKSNVDGSYYEKLDSLARLMQRYPDIVIEIGGHTDSKGKESYNLILAQKRVDACIKYLVKKGISKQRLVGKAYGECCPLEPEIINGRDNPAARERNRRVEYKLLKGEVSEQ
ncbi:MAG: OmpA family protein [Chitinophagaceae bacterium]|nr:OmpA family protein [Chitinophagaceae bacterium]